MEFKVRFSVQFFPMLFVCVKCNTLENRKTEHRTVKQVKLCVKFRFNIRTRIHTSDIPRAVPLQYDNILRKKGKASSIRTRSTNYIDWTYFHLLLKRMIHVQDFSLFKTVSLTISLLEEARLHVFKKYILIASI